MTLIQYKKIIYDLEKSPNEELRLCLLFFDMIGDKMISAGSVKGFEIRIYEF